MTRQKATPEQVAKVKLCLKEEFLLRLIEPNANHYWPEHPNGFSWRYLFRRHCLRCSGVYDRIPEGHPNGLPSIVNQFIHTKCGSTFSRKEIGVVLWEAGALCREGKALM